MPNRAPLSERFRRRLFVPAVTPPVWNQPWRTEATRLARAVVLPNEPQAGTGELLRRSSVAGRAIYLDVSPRSGKERASGADD